MVEQNGLDEDRVSVDLVLAGDNAAFAAIVHRWQGPLINMAWRFCRDRPRAEDMAQEAFLKAFRNLAQWRHEAKFSTWLFALAANVYRSELKRIPAVTLPLDEVAEPRDPRYADDPVEAADRSAWIQKAVDALPEKYRAVIVLYYFHEEDLLMTSRTLGVAPGTVKVRLFRARELLKRKLATGRQLPSRVQQGYLR